VTVTSISHSIYGVFVLMGLTVGFGHCIGMCGPIAVSVSLSAKGKRPFLSHVLYNGGRILTYVLLGGLMGFFGSFTRFAVNLMMIQKTVLLLTGLGVAVTGLVMAGVVPGIRIFDGNPGSGGVLAKGLKYFAGRNSPPAYLYSGMLLGLLPCGPVYAALAASAGAAMEARTPLGGVLTGMGAMFCFGLGTAPSLLALGKLAVLGLLKWRPLVYRLGGLVMTGMGVYFVCLVFR